LKADNSVQCKITVQIIRNGVHKKLINDVCQLHPWSETLLTLMRGCYLHTIVPLCSCPVFSRPVF